MATRLHQLELGKDQSKQVEYLVDCRLAMLNDALRQSYSSLNSQLEVRECASYFDASIDEKNSEEDFNAEPSTGATTIATTLPFSSLCINTFDPDLMTMFLSSRKDKGSLAGLLQRTIRS